MSVELKEYSPLPGALASLFLDVVLKLDAVVEERSKTLVIPSNLNLLRGLCGQESHNTALLIDFAPSVHKSIAQLETS